jgi:hypothetical protein
LHYNDIVESDRAKYHQSNKVYSKNKDKQGFSGRSHTFITMQYTKHSANNGIIALTAVPSANANSVQSAFKTTKVSTYSLKEQIPLMTKVMYSKQHQECDKLHLDPDAFQEMLEKSDARLKGFLRKLEKAVIPFERTAYNKKESRKQVVVLCYTMAGMRNKFVNDLKLQVGLSLDAAGTTWDAIDRLNKCGYSADPQTIENYKKTLVEQHPREVQRFFEENVSGK